MVEAIEQATCAECGKEEDIRVTERTYESPEPDSEEELVDIRREVECVNCRSEGVVTITGDGLEVTGALDYSDASWNQEE